MLQVWRRDQKKTVNQELGSYKVTVREMLKLELKNIFDCDDVIFIIQIGMTN